MDSYVGEERVNLKVQKKGLGIRFFCGGGGQDKGSLHKSSLNSKYSVKEHLYTELGKKKHPVSEFSRYLIYTFHNTTYKCTMP